MTVTYYQSGADGVFQWLSNALIVLLSLCILSMPAYAQVTTQYTNSTDSPVGDISQSDGCAIGSSVQRDFIVNDDFVVDDVDIGVLLAHGERDDVAIFLAAPGTGFTLIKTLVGGTADNFNVLLDDEAAAPITSHTANDTATPGTAVPPYQRSFTPTNSLNGAFTGISSLGTWRLVFCDFSNNGVDGTFFQSDLFLTSASNVADLSLNKTVASASPSTAVYTLSVTNAGGSDLTATGVSVTDNLPAGVTFTGSSGTGTYNAGTGIWTIPGGIAPGQTVSIQLNVNITAAIGTDITNTAQIRTSNQPDPDSTPNNNVTTEDDYDSVTFAVGGRIAGIPPIITSICAAAGVGTTVLDWNSQNWVSGSLTGSANVTNLGTVDFTVSTQGSFNAPLALTLDNDGGLGAAGLSLFQSIEYSNINQTTSTIVTLPTAVAGAQLTVFDVDFNANDFADELTVTGSFNGGAPISAVLTNSTANFINAAGNAALGDGTAAGNTADGNVIATFTGPVDTITITYGNHAAAPSDPDGQAASIHDFTFCEPAAELSVTKSSSVIADTISSNNPKAIPGATVEYCINISNTGPGTATGVSASDVLPGDVTFIPGSLRTGATCATASDVEDDDATGADESDPFGMSFASGTVTGTANSLTPGQNLALVFNVVLD